MNEEIILIDSENLEKINEFLNLHIKDELLITNAINTIYNNMNANYTSENNKLLDSLEMDNLLNLKTVKTNHEANVFLVTRRIEHVKEKLQKLKEIDDTFNIGRID